MTLKLVLDRYEDDLGVCLDFENKRHYISKSILGNIRVNDIFTVEFDGEIYFSPTVLQEETEKAKEDVSKRMKKLFKMTRDRRPPKL